MDSQSNEKHFNLVAQESKPLNNPTIPNIGYNSLQNEPYQRDFDFPNGQINQLNNNPYQNMNPQGNFYHSNNEGHNSFII